jgi:hypothetical protein
MKNAGCKALGIRLKRKEFNVHGITEFAAGSRVYVTSYSPFRGLRGTIQVVNTIASDLEEPFCFYLITLEGAHVREPIWFEYDEVELVAPPTVALYERG